MTFPVKVFALSNIRGVTKRETEKEQIDVKGYAIGFKRVDSQCIDSSGFYCQRCWPYDRDI